MITDHQVRYCRTPGARAGLYVTDHYFESPIKTESDLRTHRAIEAAVFVRRREYSLREFLDWYARATVEVRRRGGKYAIATELTTQVQRLRFSADVVMHRSTPLER